MVNIFPETHKRVVREINRDITNQYGIHLNLKKLEWGAISPDILPKYKFIRHYKEESINYVVKEIITIIYIFQFTDLKRLNSLQNKILSTKLGVISHYLSDYVCLPHARRWTCNQHLKEHLRYERILNKLSQNHIYNKEIIKNKNISIDNDEYVTLKTLVKDYIENIVQEYNKSEGKDRDLDFAYGLNFNIFSFIFETIEVLSTERCIEKSFVF
ncbi:zinc dependent phospholipase C family protein [uncultured Finegoldia sp.]|uniref:zinc dependent phospholipase C family protein n=1 Tax=uncultured Finegoldia sp. TaxID=328009 RepID=UPI00261954E6|nr:zinc dependent phospholipase C family protein [uncultured Finegoldia sp.]